MHFRRRAARDFSAQTVAVSMAVDEQTQNALPAPFLVLLICALSVSGAIFLILEMNHPLSGFIKVSSAPMLKALEHLGQ
jgi:hypothetical protein